MDVHPRVLRYFLVLAEELHFRRAAERLYITSPALSQQIRHLESTLGTELLHRTSRSVELTDKGIELIPLARAMVAAADEIAVWARTDPGDEKVLRIGYMATGAGDSTQTILRSAEEALTGVDIRLRYVDWGEQTKVIVDGEVDVAFIRDPAPVPDLRKSTVLTEARVVILPVDHPLAARDSLHFDDIAGERFLPSATGSPEWIDYWLVNPRPDGSTARLGPPISSVEEMLDYCAAGRGIAITAASVSRFYAHPGVRFVEIVDLPPTHVFLAARKDNTDPLVQRFEELALSVAR
ncbi:LysR family transcriptional regulator [Gordonia sp. NPDC003424]